MRVKIKLFYVGSSILKYQGLLSFESSWKLAQDGVQLAHVLSPNHCKQSCTILKTYEGSATDDVANENVTHVGVTNVGVTDVGVTDVGVTDVGVTDVGVTNVGATDGYLNHPLTIKMLEDCKYC